MMKSEGVTMAEYNPYENMLSVLESAADLLGLEKNDFIHEVKGVLGVVTFLELSEGGRTLFI